jgi:hypothetical protein
MLGPRARSEYGVLPYFGVSLRVFGVDDDAGPVNLGISSEKDTEPEMQSRNCKSGSMIHRLSSG